jgi:hypothetical protein
LRACLVQCKCSDSGVWAAGGGWHRAGWANSRQWTAAQRHRVLTVGQAAQRSRPTTAAQARDGSRHPPHCDSTQNWPRLASCRLSLYTTLASFFAARGLFTWAGAGAGRSGEERTGTGQAVHRHELRGKLGWQEFYTSANECTVATLLYTSWCLLVGLGKQHDETQLHSTLLPFQIPHIFS